MPDATEVIVQSPPLSNPAGFLPPVAGLLSWNQWGRGAAFWTVNRLNKTAPAVVQGAPVQAGANVLVGGSAGFVIPFLVPNGSWSMIMSLKAPAIPPSDALPRLIATYFGNSRAYPAAAAQTGVLLTVLSSTGVWNLGATINDGVTAPAVESAQFTGGNIPTAGQQCIIGIRYDQATNTIWLSNILKGIHVSKVLTRPFDANNQNIHFGNQPTTNANQDGPVETSQAAYGPVFLSVNDMAAIAAQMKLLDEYNGVVFV